MKQWGLQHPWWKQPLEPSLGRAGGTGAPFSWQQGERGATRSLRAFACTHISRDREKGWVERAAVGVEGNGQGRCRVVEGELCWTKGRALPLPRGCDASPQHCAMGPFAPEPRGCYGKAGAERSDPQGVLKRGTNGSGQQRGDVPGRAWGMEQPGWEMLLVAEPRPELPLQ